MTTMTDIEIAQNTPVAPILEIAEAAGIPEKYLECYGRDKAKIDLKLLDEMPKADGHKLVLVTAMTPTPAGEGKTTMLIGLNDALRKIGVNSIASLREPSQGPVFGLKGGAAGGGHAQVLPMEDFNLHFTGDFHAITAANNLLAAMVDNHIQQGNELGIDPRKVTWRRCLDINDRQLRFLTSGLGGRTNGVPREDGFDITAACEVMALFCLATDLNDLKARLGRIIVGYTYGKASEEKPVTAADLHAEGAMTVLLKNALKPNLVQSLEHAPIIVHGGPFANIAHGCCSVLATRMAHQLADYTITEAGFGADLGAEKFFDIKCRLTGLKPDAVVMVATIRALKYHGGVPLKELGRENTAAVEAGFPNLKRHIENIQNVYGLPCLVAINAFPTDTKAEEETVIRLCRETGVKACLSTAWADGGAGSVELAKEVIAVCEGSRKTDGGTGLRFPYKDDEPIADKIRSVITKVYHGDKVSFTPEALQQISRLEKMGFGTMPVCIAKTQYSFSDDPKKLCAPEGFEVTVRQVKVSAGAGFIVALTGEIMTMPGLPKEPAAVHIDLDDEGRIVGLF